MKDSVKGLFANIYGRREPLFLSVISTWMSYAALKGYGLPNTTAIICALITAIPVVFAALTTSQQRCRLGCG